MMMKCFFFFFFDHGTSKSRPVAQKENGNEQFLFDSCLKEPETFAESQDGD